jgi:5'-nucleotidase
MKKLILVTNDDGVDSPGIIAAAEAVVGLGDVYIVAPISQQTAMSRAIPKGADIGIIETREIDLCGDKHRAFAVHGSPALAVSHAVLELCPRMPDLCISGINYGENLGLSILSSGTVGATLEANSYDIPGIAISLEANVPMQHSAEYGTLNWTVATFFTRILSRLVLEQGLPGEIALMNVNVPSTATVDTPIRVSSQSRQNYFVFRKPEMRDFAKSCRLHVETEIDDASLESGSDIDVLIKSREVSITPIAWQLSRQQHMATLSEMLRRSGERREQSVPRR